MKIHAGRILASYRAAMNWSLNEAARRSGVNKSVIARAEQQDIPAVRVDALSRILKAYGKNYRDWVLDQAESVS